MPTLPNRQVFVYERLAEALIAEGMEVAFMVAGYGNLELAEVLINRYGIRWIAARHEQGAIAMADGYSRVTGRPALCMVTQGPGLTNAATALCTAVRRRSPVVLVTGHAPVSDRQNVQRLDQRDLVLALGAGFFPLRHAALVDEDIALALRHVRLGLGPAVIDAPLDVQHGYTGGASPYKPSRSRVIATPRRTPDSDGVQKAIQLIASSRRPVVIAGRGAVEAQAKAAITTFAEQIGAFVATTLQAKDYFDGHRLSIGIAGGFSPPPVARLLARADCIVAVGASLNERTTDRGKLIGHAKVIHIDSDASRLGDLTPAEISIVGDARATVEALSAGLGSQHPTRSNWIRGITALNAATLGPFTQFADGLDPRQLVLRLNDLVPRKRTLVLDGGRFLVFPSTLMSVPDPRFFVWSQDFGTVGLGVAMGVGAAVAVPDQYTLVVVGDGGFLMSGMQEFETAVRHHIRIGVVVMNDGAFGGEVRKMAEIQKDASFVLFNNPNLASVARALGGEAVSINTSGDLDRHARVFAGSKGTVLMDARVSKQALQLLNA